MRRAAPLLLVGLLLSACIYADNTPESAGLQPPSDPALSASGALVDGHYVTYVGVIASLNPKTGEIVMMGNREDLPDKELVVKLQADPNIVDVSDISNREIDLDQVVKGDHVTIDCRIDGDTLTVESIFVYAQKNDV